MITDDLKNKLREHYIKLHPLLFHRSIEKAKTGGEAFDILDSVPEIYPLIWNETDHRWVTTDDLLQNKVFEGKE